MMNFKALLTALVVIASVAHGLALQSTSQHVDTFSNRDGQLMFWFVGENDGTYAVNTEGQLVTSVEPSTGIISAGAVKSFVVKFSPSLCSQGTFYTTVNLDTVSASGVSQRVSKVVELNVQRAVVCNSGAVVQGTPINEGDTYSNAVTGSHVSLASEFDASDVNVVINSQEGLRNVANGETQTLSLDVVNRGSPGLMQLSLSADPKLNAQLSEYSFVLERFESKRITLTIKPQELQGRQFVNLQVTRGNQVAVVKDIFVDVANSHSIELVMPQVVNTDNCAPFTLAGAVNNLGSTSESVRVTIPSIYFESSSFTVNPRGTKSFVLNMDFSQLQAGKRTLEVVLTSANSAARTSELVEFNIAQCSAGMVQYNVSYTNSGNTTINGVVASIANIPSNWQVIAPMPVNVAPNETKNFSVFIKPNGEVSAEVVPTLLVKDGNGNVLQQETLPSVKPTSATGMFLAGMFGFSGLQWIAGILLIALAIAVMSARASLNRS
ncbi:MAG: hypothetical protein V1722_01285 [Candidatus Micrarchaeota archaeon]